ncbi:DUF4149 domain-containing protein [Kaarinaea lacus]
MYFFMVGERILLTMWVGSLWAIGYIAAPTLFALLDDRKLAGALAGQMFHIVSYIGLVCGVLLFISLVKRVGIHWRVWVIAIMLVMVACGEFILQPMMESLKAQGLIEGSAIKKQFGMLHGVASIIYLIESVLGLSLVVFGLEKSETTKTSIAN